MEGIRVLGPISVTRGHPRAVGGPLQQAVLAVLLAERGRPVSLDRLIDEVWGDQPPTSVKSSVQSYVSNLRKTLAGLGEIEGRSGNYRLVLAATTAVDVDDAEALADRAQEAAETGGVIQATALYAEAAEALAFGVPFDGIDTPTIAIERSRILERRLVCQERTLEGRLASEDPSALVPDLVEAVGAKPLREHRTALLMTALYRSGRQAESLDAYQSLRLQLSEELGLDPSPDLSELERAVLNQDPALMAPDRVPAMVARAEAPSASSLFVGRSSQLGLIASLARSTREGNGSTALVAGEAGIGKTAFIGAALQPLEDFASIYARTEPTGDPLRAVRQAALGLLDALGTRETDLADARNRLSPLLRSSNDADLTRKLDRLGLNSNMQELAQRAAQLQPVVLVFEDLHWAGTATLDVFASLASIASEEHLLVIGTYRHDEVDIAALLTMSVGTLSQNSGLDVLHLEPLTEAEIEQITREARPELDVQQGHRLARSLARATGGNAYFVSELVDSFLLRTTTGRDGVAGPSQLPDPVRRAVRSRLSRLDESARETVRLASLLGVQFDIADLRAIAGEHTVADIAQAEAAGLVERVDETAGVRFRHELTCRVVRDDLGGIEKAAQHLRIARSLQARPEDRHRAAELAHHMAEASGLVTDAEVAEALTNACIVAAASGALKEAVELGEQALRAAEQQDDLAVLLEAMLALGESQRSLGVPEYRNTLIRATRRAIDADALEHALRAVLLLTAEGTSLTMGEVDAELMQLVDELVAQQAQWGGIQSPELLAARASLLQFSPRSEEREVQFAEALELAEATGDDNLIANVLYFANFTVDAPSQTATRAACEARLRQIASLQRDRRLLFEADRLAFGLAACGADRAAMDETHGRMMATARFLQRADMAWVVSYQEVIRHTLDGRLDEAELEAAHCIEMSKAAGVQEPRWTTIYATHVMVVRQIQGRAGELGAIAESLSAELGHLPALLSPYFVVLDAMGEEERAREVLSHIVSESGVLHMHDDLSLIPALSALSGSLARLGNGRQIETVRKVLVDAGLAIAWAGSTVMGVTAASIAELSLVLGQDAEAAEWADRALEDCASLRAVAFEPRLRWIAAQCQRALGDDVAADRHETMGRELAETLSLPFPT